MQLARTVSLDFNNALTGVLADVRHAVEQAFHVRVVNVNTLNRKGKSTRNRRTNIKGHRPNTKRAIVTLHPDDSIDLFDR